MITFKEWFEENFSGEELPQGEVNGRWFNEHYLPMIVACTSCGTTMTLFSAIVEAETRNVYCSSCAGIDEI